MPPVRGGDCRRSGWGIDRTRRPRHSQLEALAAISQARLLHEVARFGRHAFGVEPGQHFGFECGICGLVGCSIEDARGNPDAPIFELSHATERIAAAAAAARALPFPFTLTGRTENFLRGRLDLDDTIKRLKAYEAAGADALMAPGLPDLESVRAVCAAVGKPFNFMVGIKGKSFTVAALAAAGVKRISLAISLYRAAMTALLSAAKEVREHGTFG